METLLLDLRYALRRLAAVPGFTAGAVLSLALGIGASTAIFSAVNGILLQPLPYQQADRLVALPREGDVESDVSIPDADDWRAQSRSFESIAAFAQGHSYDLVGEGEPERLDATVAEPDYFAVLKIQPLLGRFYGSAENQLGGEYVAVLSEGFWRRRFAADSSIVGRSITLSDHPTRVIGVAPASADFLGHTADIYLPPATATPWAMHERGTNHLEAFGRLKAGVSLEAAREELRSITVALRDEYPLSNGGKVIRAADLREFMVGNVRQPLLVLLGAIALVLLITCVNLANFLLARATERRQELAVRLALGAGRGRLLRQLLAESLAVSLLGGVAGVALAVWGRDLLASLGPAALPRLAEVRLDWRVLSFALALALSAGMAVGLLPALEAGRGSPADALGGSRGSAGKWRSRRLDALAALQVALALVLVVGAGLLTRSFNRLQHGQLGFAPERTLMVDLSLPSARYGDRAPEQTQAFTGMVNEAAGLPGAIGAAFMIGPPFNDSRIGHTVLLEDRPHTGVHDGVGARVRPFIGDYFHLMQVPLVQGRLLTAADDEHAARVVVVNQTFAHAVWPGQDPLGRRLAFRLGNDSLIWRSVVGVVGDTRATTMAAGDESAVYLPYAQRDVTWESFGTLIVKARGEPMALLRQLREAVWRVDPRLPLGFTTTMDHLVAHSVARERFSAAAMGAFAFGALLIAVQGIYAVLAYAVAMRRREIGIRIALGAERQRVVRLVLARGLAAAAAGLVLGLAGALALSRVLHSMLYETAPTDMLSFAGGAALLVATAALACWLPARRAARTDPMIALRSE